MWQKFYQPGNDKLQAGSWLKKFSSHEVTARNFLAPLKGGSGHATAENFENQRSQIG